MLTDIILSAKAKGVKSLPTKKVQTLLQSSGYNVSTNLLSSTINGLPLGIEANDVSIEIIPAQTDFEDEVDDLDNEEDNDISKMAIDSARKEVKSHKGRGL